MSFKFSAGATALLLGVLLTGAPALSLSEQYETPPEQDPAVVLEGKENGPGYAVLSPVRSDGFLRIYQLQTDQGVEQIEGDGLLKLRLSEIRVLIALESLKNDASFVDGLKQAAMKPVDFVESTVTDPVGTAKSTVSGVGRMFGRLTKGVEAAVSGKGGSPAELAKSITGQARAERELAVELGADPYTFYAPLSKKLNETASVTTAGNWTVTAITALLPGGMIVSAARQADNFRTLIVDSTPAELAERTAGTLRAAGVAEQTISRIAKNPFYTASEKAVIAYQLQAMPTVQDLDLIAAKAADAESRDIAYFQLRRVVLLETYNRTISGLGQIRELNGIPVAIRKDGLAAVVLPLDMVAWTQTVAQTFSSMHEGMAGLPFPPTGVDFLITGDLTPMAAERLTAFGWEITGNYPMPEGPVH
ncbi:MAG: hypothetical protein RIE06_10930 [Roseibium album]|nr:hypothetical protein [Roseibium album]MBG6157773.1 hypothetical protein [Labrenzia sp. EL_162]MBG6174402.1 hypothetical protein [Labrenzia sp. EL_132]MBG6195834.1 hypothetical protein [Labrenzia sp. EL_159]MBG6229316.1 hypothetical protein [Labrenzia sp. EL_208]MCR9055910.1 hypothetical protein [Paracoccaceae bacterium]